MEIMLIGFLLFGGRSYSLAGGQAVGLKHPVLDYKLEATQMESLQRLAAPFMAMSDEQACAFVPPYGYAAYCECPHCYGGVEGNNVLVWSLERPEELKCRFCGTVVYPNPQYPEERRLEGQNMLGEPISFSYYYNEEKKAAHFFSLHLWLHKRKWLTDRLTAVAKLFALTGKKEYARRVAVVLDAFARAYPHYPVLENGPRRLSFRPQKLGWPWDSGRWNYFHNEIPAEILPAYDLTYDSEAYDELSRERGYDVRERIERDFIKAAAEGAIARRDPVSNVSGYDIRSAALAGRIINDPPLVHWAYAEMRKHVTEGFFRDGTWKEGTPSYHAMTIGGLWNSFDAVRGYSDPPGYTHPETGLRLDNVQPEKDLALWQKCQHAFDLVSMPNGFSSCIHDTHPYERRSPPREASSCAILPGLGHASLGRGRGRHQMLAQLHFSGGYGHQHYDNLNLTLWAKGREMLPDIGYTWTQMRYWASCSLGHNLVVVDRRDQDSSPPGNLQLYWPGETQNPESLQPAVVEASAEAAYAKLVPGLDIYQRLLMLVPVSADDAYVVDIFRVRGGKIHDWTIQGDADRDTQALCSLPLSGRRQWLLEEGEEWREPTLEGHRHNPYGMIRDVQSAECKEGACEIDIREQAEDSPRLRCWIRASGPCQIFLGRSPSVRRMGVGSNADMRKGYDFWMPKLLVRRTGEGALTSIFAAVHEPYEQTGFIRAVRRVKIRNGDEMALALQIEHEAGLDTILSAGPVSSPAEITTENGVHLQGRLGFIRQQEGKIVSVWLFAGTKFSGPDWEIAAQAAGLSGEIMQSLSVNDGAKENAFVTNIALPEGATLAGRWLIAIYPGGITQGYEIRSIRREGGRWIVELTEDPFVRIQEKQAEETCFPRRKFSGPVRFWIPGVTGLWRTSQETAVLHLTTPTEITIRH